MNAPNAINMKTDGSTLIFVHVPKTGGITLRQVIDRIYGRTGEDDNQFKILGRKQFIEGKNPLDTCSHSTLSKLKVIYGHFGYGVHLNRDFPSRYITLLRHPVERLISMYYHHLENHPEQLWSEEKTRHFSLEELLQREMEPQKQLIPDNQMVRYFSTESGYPTDVTYGECTVQMLEKAKETLSQNFDVVGITERFNESLMLMMHTLAWPMPYYHRDNVNKIRPVTSKIDPDTIMLVETHNQLDLELYAFAQDLFEKQISKNSSVFEADLKRFITFNPVVSSWYKFKQISSNLLVHRPS